MAMVAIEAIAALIEGKDIARSDLIESSTGPDGYVGIDEPLSKSWGLDGEREVLLFSSSKFSTALGDLLRCSCRAANFATEAFNEECRGSTSISSAIFMGLFNLQMEFQIEGLQMQCSNLRLWLAGYAVSPGSCTTARWRVSPRWVSELAMVAWRISFLFLDRIEAQLVK
jgi:hypothetical protein